MREIGRGVITLGRNKTYQENICSTNIEEDEIDLYELWLTIKKRRKIIYIITAFFLIVAVLYAFLSPKVYRSQATIIPLGGNKGGGIASLIGSFVPLPTGQSGLTCEAVLNSRLIREKIVEDLNLLPVLFKDKWDPVRKKWILEEGEEPPTIVDGANKLQGLLSSSSDKKTGVITINADFPEEPVIAYKIANSAIENLDRILNEKAFTLAKKYRIYIEERLEEAKKRIDELEKLYVKFSKGEIKKVPFLVGNDNVELGKLKGKLIAEKEKLKLLKEKQGTSQEEIEKQLTKISILEKKIKDISKNLEGDFVSAPEYQFNLMKLQSEIAIAKGLYQALVQEYELAKAQEMKEQVAFQVIDPPLIPKVPVKPKKKLIIVVALISGLFVGVFVAFFTEWLDSVKKNRKVYAYKEKKEEKPITINLMYYDYRKEYENGNGRKGIYPDFIKHEKK